MSYTTLVYVPVLHQGYLDFFKKYPGTAYILGRSILDKIGEKHPRFSREIREVSPGDIRKALSAILEATKVKIATPDDAFDHVISPEEDITQLAVRYFFPSTEVEWVRPYPFLRWDKPITEGEQEVQPDETVSKDALHKGIMERAFTQAEKSSDWWRQIGAVAMKDDSVLLTANNRHLPSDHSPYSLGDPRNNFSAGEKIELSTAIHAEAELIAKAAKEGISLDGADIFVTTFPCPVCAKSIVEAGFSRVFYAQGYSLMYSQELFKSKGIETIRVLMSD